MTWLNTHIPHKNVEKYEIWNASIVIINILSESGLISCSFTPVQPRKTTHVCFQGQMCVFTASEWVRRSRAPIYMTTLHLKTQTHFLCLVALTQQRGKKNIWECSLTWMYFFSSRMGQSPLLKWRLASVSRNLELSNCSQLMGEQYSTECLMKPEGTQHRWGNWCLGDVMVGYHNVELPLQQANNDFVKCCGLTLPVFDFNMIPLF